MTLRDIHGIGKTKEFELKTHYKINNITSLRKCNKIIPGLLNRSQRLGLKYYSKIAKKTKRANATKHVKYILKKLPNAKIAGSYRREEKMIGDLDVITFLNISLAKQKLGLYLVEIFSESDLKLQGIVRVPNTDLYRKIDIIKSTKSDYPFMLLYLTGDYMQNIIMRRKAKKLGYTLNRYNMYHTKSGKAIKISSEKKIFSFLRMNYKDPKNRSHKDRKVLQSKYI
tara:strand:+ start:383 stop:1060 length:678 start_codon:yes stop_codon:yes gene_type:complete